MAPSTPQQELHRAKIRDIVFSKRPRSAMSVEAPSSGPSSEDGASEILLEITTPGAREPIHFVEESSAFRDFGGRFRARREAAKAAAASARAHDFSKPLFPGASSLLPMLVEQQHNRHRYHDQHQHYQQQHYQQQHYQQQQQQQQQWQQQQQRRQHQRRGQSCSVSETCSPHKHRRTSSPMDGACFTLLGVIMGLKTPDADHWTVARALVESSVDLRTRNAKGMTPLHLACAGGQVDVAKVLLLAGADAHARDHRSRCPLHMAALSGSEELANALLTCGANPNKASDLGTTALHNAALLGRVGVCRALLMARADPNATDHNSFSPLYLAAQNGHTQVVLDLLASGADASIKTTRGFTPLHVAARCGRLTVLRVLLDAGLPVDCASTPAETTPLHLAGGFSREACVEELLHRGADPSKTNKRGATPLDLVGTLLPPNAHSSNGSGQMRAALEQGAQVKRVRLMLIKATRWRRRRDAVLLCEALRSKVIVSASSAPKRFRGSLNRAGAEDFFSSGQGWVIEQLCAQVEPLLIRNVIRFL